MNKIYLHKLTNILQSLIRTNYFLYITVLNFLHTCLSPVPYVSHTHTHTQARTHNNAHTHTYE